MNRLALMTRVARERGPARTLAWLGLRLAKALRLGFDASDARDTAALPVEVVYVATDKDLATLPHSLASLDLCRGVDIRSTVIVGPPGSQIEKFAAERGLRFCNEIDVLGFGPDKYEYPVGSGGSRSGWLFQQMIKLGWSGASNYTAYIIIDADTIVTSPLDLFEGGRYIMYRSEEWQESYASAVQKVAGYKDRSLLSFVSHMMIFDTEGVRQMLSEIESNQSASWTDVIASTRSLDAMSCFSEYQLYGSWMKRRHPEKVRSKPLYNRSISRAVLRDDAKIAELSRSCHTVSAHSYIAPE